MHDSDSLYRPDPACWAGAAITLATHAMVLACLISEAPAGKALDTVAPLMVRWIQPESPVARVPRPELMVKKMPGLPPQMKVRHAPEPENPTLAAPAPASAATAVSRPQDPGSPALVEARVAPPGPSPIAPLVAPPVVPPDFTARYLDNPAPSYPPLARRLGEEGRVMLRVHVEVSGLPSKVEIRTSSGSERLDQAALEVVKRWKFVPARQGDIAVPAAVLVPVAFSLRG